VGNSEVGRTITIRVVADTHALLWYLYNDPRLSTTALTFLETTEKAGDQIAISSIMLAEMVYLIEKARIQPTAFERVTAALDQPDTSLVEIPFDRPIAQAMRQIERDQVPDFPDRIIAATAKYLDVPVISRDRKIRSSDVSTIW